MMRNEEYAEQIYARWKADQLNLTVKLDIVDKLKARYAQSIGENGGPSVDVISRQAYEEIEQLRARLAPIIKQ